MLECYRLMIIETGFKKQFNDKIKTVYLLIII